MTWMTSLRRWLGQESSAPVLNGNDATAPAPFPPLRHRTHASENHGGSKPRLGTANHDGSSKIRGTASQSKDAHGQARVRIANALPEPANHGIPVPLAA